MTRDKLARLTNRSIPLLVVSMVIVVSWGCRPSSGPSASQSGANQDRTLTIDGDGESAQSASSSTSTGHDAADRVAPVVPQTFEASAEDLLSARLGASRAAEGWIRLFDGATLFGWEIAGAANWRVENGSIVVDQGDVCLLCTALPWQDYELSIEFRADEKTNSGVFLRTPLEPDDPAVDCYEINIAPDDNPFPTASVVGRKRVESPLSDSSGQWRKMLITLQGGHVQVSVDDAIVCDYTDPAPLAAGRIGLQHNQGRIEFRDIQLRPLGLQSLLDAQLSQWKPDPEMPDAFVITPEGQLHVQGGPAQLESAQQYGDFVLLAEYKLARPDVNSGIFFRCIPGDRMMGYECQLNDQALDGNRIIPADCGTGGIFRRQNARVVAGEVNQWNTVMLVAHQASMGAWVNGIQVSNWMDDRPDNSNPRRGRRLEAGTLILQAHDPGTDAWFKQIAIAPVAPVAPVDPPSVVQAPE